MVFPGDGVEVEQHLEEWLSMYVGWGWLVENIVENVWNEYK